MTPYLNNSSEETIFGSNKVKKQQETIKLQNEVRLKLWLLMNWNRPAIDKKAICIIVYEWQNILCLTW